MPENIIGLCIFGNLKLGEIVFGETKRNTSNWSNFCMLLRRAGLTASAGLSCLIIRHKIHKPMSLLTRVNAVIRDINEASFFRLFALFIICLVAKNVSRDCACCISVTVHNGCDVSNFSYTERLHPRTRLTAESNKC